MFVSLNKKFMCVFFLFFLLVVSLFLGFFSIYYDKNVEAEAQNFVETSSRLIDVAYNNNYLVGQIKKAVGENRFEPDEITKSILSDDNNAQNRKIIESLNNIYNKKYDRLQYLWRFVSVGLVWISAGVLLLWFLLQYMVLRPVNRLISVSEDVANGDFGQRVNMKDQLLKDEFFVLSHTFNQMLQNIEDSIIKIKNNQYFLQAIIDAIPDGLRVMDEQGKIVLANRAYVNLLGIKKCIGEFCYRQSMNAKSFCPENKMRCPIREFQKNKATTLSTIQYFAKDPNRPISVNAAKMELEGENGKTEYIIEALRDLSQEIKFSHQQKISSLAFLATSIAHEMKNNLGSLRMVMEQLMEINDFKDSRTKAYFNLAYTQVLECIKIPESLLNLSKNPAKKADKIKLKNIVESVCSLLDYEAKRRGVEISVALDDKIIIMGNEPDLKMIFLNLCQNSIKAMPNGGKLSIEAKGKADVVEINVKDTGVGIEKSQQKRIFEPFFSIEGNNTGNQGNGLGLPIVKSLVENFKGKITFKSKKNVGTVFTMQFPLKK